MAPEQQADWRLTLVTGALAFTFVLAFMIIDALGLSGRPFHVTLRVGHLVLVCAVTAYVWTRRRSPSRRLCAGAFVAIVTPFLVTFGAVVSELGAVGARITAWSPFIGNDIAMFCIAGLCPRPRWLAPALILVFAAEEVAFWFLLDLKSVTANIPADEPWSSMAFTILALALYGVRVYFERSERELMRARAEAAMLRTMNEAFLAVHDMANTPLQKLELVLALLKDGRAANERLMTMARQALVQLHEIGNLLPMTAVTSASVDPAVLKQVRGQLSRRVGANAIDPPRERKKS